MVFSVFDSSLGVKVRPFGKWQLLVFLLVVLPNEVPRFMVLQLANIGPAHVCAAPWFAGWSYTEVMAFSNALANVSGRDNVTAASNSGDTIASGDSDRASIFACHRFDLTAAAAVALSRDSNSSVEEQQRALLSAATEPGSAAPALERCPGQWLYDLETAPYRYSLIEAFDLVCERRILIPNSAAWFGIGMAVGSLFGAPLGDRFGRKTLLTFSASTGGLIFIGISFCRNFWLFVSLLTLSAVIFNTGYVSGVLLILEATDHRHRNTLAVARGLYNYSIGPNIVTGLSFLLQDWRHVYLAMGILNTLTVLYTCLLPESPTWLVAAGHQEAANRVVRKAFVLNGGSPADAASISVSHIAGELKGRELSASVASVASVSVQKDCLRRVRTGLDLWCSFFASWASARRWLPLGFIWTVVAGVYYGITFYAVRLPGNPYLIAVLTNLIVVPSIFAQWFLYRRFDRKRPIVALLTLSGVCCLVGGVAIWSPALPQQLSVAMATLVVGVTAAVFEMLYLYTPELFPTLHRSTALGFLGGVARVGMFAGVFTERLDQLVWPPLPLLAMAAAVGLASVCCVLLPREEAVEIPVSIEDEPRESSKLEEA